MGILDKLKEIGANISDKFPKIKFKKDDIEGPPEEIPGADFPPVEEPKAQAGAETGAKAEAPAGETDSPKTEEKPAPAEIAPVPPLPEKPMPAPEEKPIENPEEKFFSAIDKFSLEDLRKRKSDLEKMLKVADEELSAGIITERSYNEIRRNAGEKLKEVSFELKAVEKLLSRVSRAKSKSKKNEKIVPKSRVKRKKA